MNEPLHKPGSVTRDWIEDFEQENGHYVNRCTECNQLFLGHKRRRICKDCDRPLSPPTTDTHRDPLPLAYTPTKSEVQSGFTRLRWAEGLIVQLPSNHEGRNSWLLNYGVGEVAAALREHHGVKFDPETQAAETVK